MRACVCVCVCGRVHVCVHSCEAERMRDLTRKIMAQYLRKLFGQDDNLAISFLEEIVLLSYADLEFKSSKELLCSNIPLMR